jgi:valyl-tRNA synthetase
MAALPHEGEALMIAQWPKYSEDMNFTKEEAEMESIMAAIKAIRTLRSERNVPPSKRPHLIAVTDKTATFTVGIPFLKKLPTRARLR